MMDFVDYCLCLVVLMGWISPSAFPYTVEVSSILFLASVANRRWR